jgi:SAM-dependent methyltransferase
MNTTNGSHLIGAQVAAMQDDGEAIAFDDATIGFFCRHARGKSVLDVGCVNHNPENYKSRFWVHKALKAVASRCLGMDLYAPGVAYLRERGYDVVEGNAEGFDVAERFDAVVAGEIIEHLGNVSGFLESAKRHLRPGGVLLVSTPNPWYWRFVAKAFVSPDVHPNPEHVSWFCVATLRTLLERHGYSVMETSLGSRYRRDLLMPLPQGVKHTTIHIAARPA